MNTFALLVATLAIGVCALNLDKAKPPESRIINGIEASTTDVPYQVLILSLTNNEGEVKQCGGALISKRHVLTAAHCFDKSKKEGYAYLGTNRYGEGLEITFSQVEIHRDYKKATLENDIAIVRLDKKVKPDGKTIAIIDLDTKTLKSNVVVTASGYGNVADNVTTDNLYYTQLTSIKNEDCQVYSKPVTEKMVCTLGEKGKATCPGDSGGPLVRNWPDNPVHVGIVSFGPDSCHKVLPDVFTRTSKYIDWINSHMK